jgi:hypothetical protein
MNLRTANNRRKTKARRAWAAERVTRFFDDAFAIDRRRMKPGRVIRVRLPENFRVIDRPLPLHEAT